MNRYPRSVRLVVFAAALLHALVGGWGAWLHGAPPQAGATVHAAAGVAADASLHDADCALCHSATLARFSAGRPTLWPAGNDRATERFAAPRPSSLSSAPLRYSGARAPPRLV